MRIRGLISPAEGLLTAVLGNLPPSHVRSRARRLLDRVAIFNMNEKAIMARVERIWRLKGSPGLDCQSFEVNDAEEGEEEAEADDEEIEGEEERFVASNRKTNAAQLNNITEKLRVKRRIWHCHHTAPFPKRQRSYTQTPPPPLPPALGQSHVPPPAQGLQPGK
ncbi:unnamed protein product [Tuber aestivum]|uniref:Uncharacterized protein n=1 Tax=Tuber aestivum TaxID=59557 RepID=A0A292Q1X7_9PEZI|nr:unnamed protein product [Tuber aestivum]